MSALLRILRSKADAIRGGQQKVCFLLLSASHQEVASWRRGGRAAESGSSLGMHAITLFQAQRALPMRASITAAAAVVVTELRWPGEEEEGT